MAPQAVWMLALLGLLCMLIPISNAQDTMPGSRLYAQYGDEKSAAEQQHIYDTSLLFFNLKNSVHELYAPAPTTPHANSKAEAAKLKEEDEFWYVNSVEKFKASAARVQYDKAYRDSLDKAGEAAAARRFDAEEKGIALPSWVNQLAWFLIIGIFMFAVAYFLMANKINIFSRSSQQTPAVTAGESDDLFSIPYQQLLQKAYADKNYRLAVRMLYLQTLKVLSEKNLIRFQADYTNLHYLQQLAQSPLYNDFFTITRHYEYVWYGEFVPSEAAFHRIKTDFTHLYTKAMQA